MIPKWAVLVHCLGAHRESRATSEMLKCCRRTYGVNNATIAYLDLVWFSAGDIPKEGGIIIIIIPSHPRPLLHAYRYGEYNKIVAKETVLFVVKYYFFQDDGDKMGYPKLSVARCLNL